MKLGLGRGGWKHLPWKMASQKAKRVNCADIESGKNIQERYNVNIAMAHGCKDPASIKPGLGRVGWKILTGKMAL